MVEFSQTISNWETFYLLMGTASVTLIGLLFIAISINLDVVRNESYPDLQLFAAVTLNCFFYVLVFSFLFLIPNQTPLGLGLPIFLFGGVGLTNTVNQWRRAMKIDRSKMSHSRIGKGISRRFILPILCLVGLVIISVMLLFGSTAGLYSLVFVTLLLVGSATQNAWFLLVRAYIQDEQAAGSE
jgi:hypothetical protein